MSAETGSPPASKRAELGRPVVRVRVRWGADAVLREHHVPAGSSYRVRADAGGQELTLGRPGDSSALTLAAPEGDRLRIFVPDAADLKVTRSSHHLGRRQLGALGRMDDDGRGASFLLEPGETASVTLGTLAHEISTDVLPTAPRTRLWPSPLVVASAIITALLVAFTTADARRGGSRSGGGELPDLRDRAIAALVRERALHPPALPAVRHVVTAVAPFVAPIQTAASRPSVIVPPEVPSAVVGRRVAPARASTSASQPAAEPEHREYREAPAPSAEELAELAENEARDRNLRRMRRQVSQLGDCYEELGIAPGSGPPSDPGARARLSECVARRQRLAEANEAAAETRHAVLEWGHVEVEDRTGTVVFQGGTLEVPVAH